VNLYLDLRFGEVTFSSCSMIIDLKGRLA